MDAAETIRDYYEALRRGEPLYPYFAERAGVVKFGVGERLVGYDAVAEGLREQTRRTTDWTVESEELRVSTAGETAWFSDAVYMAWTDVEADHDYAFTTRWSGTLVRRDDEWVFVGMHVSTPHVA
jgi:hypothetical protein